MPITPQKCGVWILDDSYKKLHSGYWPYSGEAACTLWAWGSNTVGRLGDGTTISRSSPVLIPGTQWSNISGNVSQTLALKTDGTLWSWGQNTCGQLGDGTRIHRSSPVQVPGTQWNNISASPNSNTSLARKTDGTLWIWGYNVTGAIGDGTVIHRSSPVQVPGTQWNNISAGNFYSLAIKTDGTLWSWGYNGDGLLGDNSTIHRSSPVQIPGTQWNDISAGSRYSLARKTDGTMWSWGNNNNGRLGDGTFIHRSSPVQIPGTQWNDMSIGTGLQDQVLARKTDGTLWSWGSGNCGMLGNNSTIGTSSPIQIPGTQWNDICATVFYSLARKTDGTLWSWGCNGAGGLGDGTTIQRSSPVQIPGTQWIDLSVSRARKAEIL